MQLSTIISAVIVLGIVTLSSANRIPPRNQRCKAACENYANNCDRIDDCPLQSCDVDDRDCFFRECVDSLGCNFKGKRNQVETTEEET